MNHQPFITIRRAAKVACIGGFVGLVITQAGAQSIWNGPMITFTEPASGTGSNPSDQDRITSDVWLTRNSTMGLYNAAEESGFTKNFSPENTEWAYGSLSNYASLTYQNWQSWNGSNPPSMVDQPAVLYLPSDNIYIGIEFLSWGQGGSGGFSYERTTAPVPEPGSGGLLLAGLGMAAAVAYGRRAAWPNRPSDP